jgi:hypothetical protein
MNLIRRGLFLADTGSVSPSNSALFRWLRGVTIEQCVEEMDEDDALHISFRHRQN